MSRVGNKLITAVSGASADFEIDQSLIFDKADAASLVRTPGSASNQRTWTWSGWVKRSETHASHIQTLFSADGNSDNSYICFYLDDIYINDYDYGNGGNKWLLITNRKFRDFSAWYHIVLAVDTTQATASNRLKLYVNGVQETSFSTETYPAQNYDGFVNSTLEHHVGTAFTSASNYSIGGQLAEVHFIDGSQLTPSSFGETNSDTNQWIPKEYSGSYGTNGFYLKFESGALGTDSSGEGNNYTAANLANSDVLLDTPTNNFCTNNPLDNGSTVLSQGNLKFVNSSGNSDTGITYAIPHTGKWYFETRLTAVDAYYAGLVSKGYSDNAGSYSGFTVYQLRYDGQWWNGSAYESYASSLSNGNILGWAIDCDNGKIYVSVNGTFANSGNPVNGTNPADTFTATADWKFITYGNADSQFDFNFGQNGTFNGLVTAQGNADGGGIGNFYYAPPTGFKALCSKNLPDPTIEKSSDHFNTVLYTGDGQSTKSITGVGFQPAFTWFKSRVEAYSHLLYDAVRGAGASKALKSNANEEEGNNDNSLYGYMSAFTSDGFDIVHGSTSSVFLNENNDNMVTWNWKGEGAAPSKTYVVKVVSDGGNKYRFDDFAASAQTVDLQEGGTYTFDQSDSSNSGHPLRFSTTSNGSHGGGSEYTTGVTTSGTPGSAGAYTRITVAASAATLYYYCTAHSGMGGQVNTNSTFGSTNFDGTIKTINAVNTTSGFSIATYAGGGGLKTIGHGLGKVPAVMIVKSTSHALDWCVYHQNMASDPQTDSLSLNDTDAIDDNDNRWNDTAPTSSVATIYSSGEVNDTGKTYLMYAFTDVEGFSKFGNYTGNGAAEEGPFVHTGFKPSFVIVKKSSASGSSWFMWDSKRHPENVIDLAVWADAQNADTSHATYEIDFLSNGFKLRGNNAGTNTDDVNYIYMAWAEAPFKYANAR